MHISCCALMLSNIHRIGELASLARAKARAFETKTVGATTAEQMLTEGWEIDKKNKKSVRLRKPKPHDELLEDRLWTLMYRMHFPLLSGEGGGSLLLNARDEESPS